MSGARQLQRRAVETPRHLRGPTTLAWPAHLSALSSLSTLPVRPPSIPLLSLRTPCLPGATAQKHATLYRGHPKTLCCNCAQPAMVLKLTTPARYVLLVLFIIVSSSSVARANFVSCGGKRGGPGRGGPSLSGDRRAHEFASATPRSHDRSAYTLSSASRTKTTAARRPSRTSRRSSRGAPDPRGPSRTSTTCRGSWARGTPTRS